MMEDRVATPDVPRGSVTHVYTLYVSTASPISQRAITNARSLLALLPSGSYALSVLNIADHVAAARAHQVIASPTLIRLSPLPQRRFIGDLSDTAGVRHALDLPAQGA